MNTPITHVDNSTRKWILIDATDKVLGRLASKAAHLLIGKDKPAYSPHQDHGDNVIIINAERIRLTGKKDTQKQYFFHSGHIGHGRLKSFRELMEKNPADVVEHAINGMIPKNKRGRSIRKKLHVYPGNTHPHQAQQPQMCDV